MTDDMQGHIEQLAKAMYERDHIGMRDIWPWDESGLDDEHPGARDRYYRHASVALEVLSNRTLWPLDKMAEKLEERGIDHPRPFEILRVFFDSLCQEFAS